MHDFLFLPRKRKEVERQSRSALCCRAVRTDHGTDLCCSLSPSCDTSNYPPRSSSLRVVFAVAGALRLRFAADNGNYETIKLAFFSPIINPISKSGNRETLTIKNMYVYNDNCTFSIIIKLYVQQKEKISNI